MADRDAISFLTSDHRTVEGLFHQYEQTSADLPERRGELVAEMMRELAMHAAVEEQYLYPFIEAEVEGGRALADEGVAEHREAEELLAELDWLAPHERRFDGLVRQLIAGVRHHVEEEETELFPALRRAADAEALRDLGRRMKDARGTAPTRPRPRAPRTPPAHKLGNRAAGLLHRTRDAVSDRDAP